LVRAGNSPQFGRKSQKLDRRIEQLELRLEDMQADEAAVAAAEPKKTRKRSESTGRKPLPDHFEREERLYQPADEACPNCGRALTELGEDVAEQLEFVRAQSRVIRHRRPKKACSCCDSIVQAPAPTRPIDRGIPGPALLAHIAVSKFVDHLPLYRQSVICARDGIDLDRSTMASWLGHLCVLVGPLVEALRRCVLAPGKVHADDTPVPVLAPGNGKTKTGRLWVYVRDDRSSGCVDPATAASATAPWPFYVQAAPSN
jgi:transposase